MYSDAWGFSDNFSKIVLISLEIDNRSEKKAATRLFSKITEMDNTEITNVIAYNVQKINGNHKWYLTLALCTKSN